MTATIVDKDAKRTRLMNAFSGYQGAPSRGLISAAQRPLSPTVPVPELAMLSNVATSNRTLGPIRLGGCAVSGRFHDLTGYLALTPSGSAEHTPALQSQM